MNTILFYYLGYVECCQKYKKKKSQVGTEWLALLLLILYFIYQVKYYISKSLHGMNDIQTPATYSKSPEF
jgi:uncharacterized protein (UPF0333 family)